MTLLLWWSIMDLGESDFSEILVRFKNTHILQFSLSSSLRVVFCSYLLQRQNSPIEFVLGIVWPAKNTCCSWKCQNQTCIFHSKAELFVPFVVAFLSESNIYVSWAWTRKAFEEHSWPCRFGVCFLLQNYIFRKKPLYFDKGVFVGTNKTETVSRT